jgi:peptide deformylase
MAVREILKMGDARLLRVAKPVERFATRELDALIADMFDTMQAASGVGLAAPQIGVPLRVIVVEYEEKQYSVINPEIVDVKGEVTDEEGCLSAPNWQAPVTRATHVLVKGRDRNGKEVRIRAEGWLARIFQHEVDHLDGVLFLDKVQDRSTIHWVEPEREDEEEQL